MIVEDEYLYACMLARVVASAGYDVVGPFSDCDSACAALAPADHGIRAATLDVTLDGGVSCHDVAEELRRQDIPFLFLTGGGITDARTRELAETVPVLSKPLRLQRILSEINDLLQSKPQTDP
ncbi:response regulator [Tropicibacter sp. S64]|uniref:response regulator n=1 Tax=Tropicibacter sp. S64 TaxID=3415122 RepID=UPI003C79CD6B